MTYFLQVGVDVDGYDPIFKKYLKNIYETNTDFMNYRPTAPFDKRDGTYVLWQQTSPTQGSWAFKKNMANFNTTPFLAPFLKDALRNEEIAQLQYDKDIASAHAILAGEMRIFDTKTSGNQANQFAIDPKTLGGFLGKVKAGIDRNINVAAMPTENTDFYQYNDTNKDMYTNQLSSSAGLGGGVARLVYSSDRMSNAEVQYAAEELYHTMSPLYNQFNNFLEFYANQLTSKYKFKFILDGCSFEFERQKRFDRLLKISEKGMVLNASAYASAIGMRPQDFERSLIEGHSDGILLNNLSTLFNANTMPKSEEAGRPRKDDTEITDSGQASRDDEGIY